MKSKSFYLFLLIFPLLISQSCSMQLKNSMEIKTNGFLTDNCYQALIEIEPDETARGLVAKRESAYLNAKKADLNILAVENLANYCIDTQLKTGIIDKTKKNFDHVTHKNALLQHIRSIAGSGSIAFIFFNEKNSMIIGYRIFTIGFKKKLDAIITTPASLKQENPTPTIRS
jgi:hypothetical protein